MFSMTKSRELDEVQMTFYFVNRKIKISKNDTNKGVSYFDELIILLSYAINIVYW